VGAFDQIDGGRESFRRRAWDDAYRSLLLADRAAPLKGDDLELLATSAYLTGHELAFYEFLERAYRNRLESGDRVRAARCAFWSGLGLLFRGEPGQASGWLARARRLVEGLDCVEQGFLLLPQAEQRLRGGDEEAARAMASDAAAIGERFADADLIAGARHLEGRALIRQKRLQAGLTLLDEAMLAVVGGELSPIMTGLLYCSVIGACQEIHALSRAREWTAALGRWCEMQPQMLAFMGTCLVHRAQILQWSGAWSEAKAELRRVFQRSSQELDAQAPSGAGPAEALYLQAELHRLCGELQAAERAYHDAARLGREPHPGLALLRMAQGQTGAASAAVLRVLSATADPLDRARLLPAVVEITLSAGDLHRARQACEELEAIAHEFDTEVLQAMAAHSRRALELAAGDPRAALSPLRQAFETWRRVEATYEIARVRMLIGQACRSLGDVEAGRLELSEARSLLERLGAVPDLSRLDVIDNSAQTTQDHRLSRRELQVLRLIACGKTNKAIAAELFVSERTIDRHVSNILTKLDVPTRSAATAYAYQHGLL